MSRVSRENGSPREEGVLAARLAIDVIELLARHRDIGVTEIAREIGTTKPRVFRHLRTLVSCGYAVQDESSERYSAGPRLMALARMVGVSAEEGLLELARPIMQQLHRKLDHSINLSQLNGDRVSIIASLPGSGLIGVSVKLNEPMPIHATAAGKLYLAELLATGGKLPARKLAAFTSHTITDPRVLRKELTLTAERGWSDAPEQHMLGINAISAPVRDHRGKLVGMLSALDSIQFIPAEPPPRLIEALKSSADKISCALAM